MRRGTRVGQAYVAVTADGDGINEEIVDAYDDAGKEIGGKGEEHGEEYGDGFSDGFLTRIRSKLGDRLERHLGSRDVAGKAGDSAGETFVDRMSEKVREVGDKISNELGDRIASRPEAVRRGIDRAFDDEFVDRIGDRMGSRLALSMSEAIDRQSSLISASINKAVSGNGGGGRGEKSLGDRIGRLFGAGARNNALNLIGKSIGGIVSLTEKASKFAIGFSNGMATAADGAGLVARLLSGFAGAGFNPAALLKGFGGLATTLPVLALSIGAVLFAASALVSVLGALLAIVIALSATIVSALVGALAVAGPLLGAFIAGAGLLTAAFTSMTEAQRSYLKNAFEPFHQAITGVGQIIFTEFTKPLYDGQSAIQVWADNLSRALVPLAGVAQSTAASFAKAGNTITASLSGPGFQKFFASLETELPSIITNLSRAFGDFLNGVGATFAAIMPVVTQFSDYLADVADNFSRWANSAAGQNSIKDFVDRAVASLKSLWGFLKEVGGLLSDLFFNRDAQNAGNGMFDGMTEALQRFRGWLKKQDLEKWFDDAKKFAEKAKKALGNFIRLITSLYEDGTLEAIGNLLSAMGDAFKWIDKWISPVIGAIAGGLADAIEDLMDPILAAVDGIQWLIDKLQALIDIANRAKQAAQDALSTGPSTNQEAPGAPQQPWDPPTPGVPQARYTMGGGGLQMPTINLRGPNLEQLQTAGEEALANTLEEHGGHMQDPTKDKGGVSGNKDKGGKGGKGGRGRKFNGALIIEEWLNPYSAWAEALLNEANMVADEIRAMAEEASNAISMALSEAGTAIRDVLSSLGRDILPGIAEAAMSTDVNSVLDSFNNMLDGLIANSQSIGADAQQRANAVLSQAASDRDSMIATAQSAYNSAVAALGAASNPKDAAKALEALKAAEKNLGAAKEAGRNIYEQAERAAAQIMQQAQAAQAQIAAAQQIIAGQGRVNVENVAKLVSGVRLQNATLAEYAQARGIVAEQLEAATAKLAEAVSLRDNYATQVADSIRSFGSLVSAQAKVIGGITQALSADDITDNLRDRLAKIREFQNNLRLLTALGLSDAAYQQIVDAGVETGGAYAEAILAGGQGSISEINNLTSQIGDEAGLLGSAAANQMYQAGVDAAQGLVDGLTSLSDQLSSAAAALGASIAQAIRNALGIASPSRVLIADMAHVGDGAVIGLDNQQVKVSAAAARLASAIKISPEVAAYEAKVTGRAPEESGERVSGNEPQPTLLWTGDMITPSEDPKAVAIETANELTARL